VSAKPEVRHDPDGSSSSPISDDRDEYPKVTQADLDRATFRVGLQALIHDTLPESMRRDDLDERLRRVIREELHREVLRPNTRDVLREP